MTASETALLTWQFDQIHQSSGNRTRIEHTTIEAARSHDTPSEWYMLATLKSHMFKSLIKTYCELSVRRKQALQNGSGIITAAAAAAAVVVSAVAHMLP